MSTNENDVILDPVAGTGTTGYVAKKFGRHFIMIEKVEKYVRAIEERLKDFQLGFERVADKRAEYNGLPKLP